MLKPDNALWVGTKGFQIMCSDWDNSERCKINIPEI